MQGMLLLTRALLCICGLAFFASTALADDDPKLLLESMVKMAKTGNYQGFFTYERGASSRSFQIFHRVHDDLEKQRLVFLDGTPLEIINEGHQLDCIHPGDAAKYQDISRPLAKLLDASNADASIWQYYAAISLPSDVVASRAVKRIYLKALDGYRYSYVFSVDAATSLMLKMQIINHNRQVLERFRFVHVEYDNVSNKDLQPSSERYAAVKHSHHDKQLEPAKPGFWSVAWVPAGFSEELAVSQFANTQALGHFMFSDGLSAFSVFIEPEPAAVHNGSLKQQGATAAVSSFFVHDGQNYRVTVVGEIPLLGATKIASSIRAN
jgi:sigma-E factor negative regulatory protein RseB